MKNIKLYSGLVLLVFVFFLGGCYTQVALDNNQNDSGYSNGDNNSNQYYQSGSDSGYTNDNQYYDNQNQPYYNLYLGFGNPIYRSYWGWYRPGINFGFSYGYYDPYYYDPFYYSTWCSPYSFSYYYPYAGYYYNNYYDYYSPYNNYPYYYYSTNQLSNRYGNSGGYRTRNNYGGRGSDGSRTGIRTGYGSFNKATVTNNTGRVYRTNGTQRGNIYTNGNRTRSSGNTTYGRGQNRNNVREKARNNNGGRSGQREYKPGNRGSYTPPRTYSPPRSTYNPPRTYSPPRSTYNPPRSYSPPPQRGSSNGGNNRGGGSRSSSGKGRGR